MGQFGHPHWGANTTYNYACGPSMVHDHFDPPTTHQKVKPFTLAK